MSTARVRCCRPPIWCSTQPACHWEPPLSRRTCAGAISNNPQTRRFTAGLQPAICPPRAAGARLACETKRAARRLAKIDATREGQVLDTAPPAMLRLIEPAGDAVWQQAAPLVELGTHHEQQHQELILMDIKHVFSVNPLLPAYQAPRPHAVAPERPAAAWAEFAGGLHEIGHAGSGFALDNEGPRHKIWLQPFRPASHPVTCGGYLHLLAAGG